MKAQQAWEVRIKLGHIPSRSDGKAGEVPLDLLHRWRRDCQQLLSEAQQRAHPSVAGAVRLDHMPDRGTGRIQSGWKRYSENETKQLWQ